jgi:hypothetical protein
MFRVLAANCREEKSLDPPDRALALMLRRKVRVGSREVRPLCTVLLFSPARQACKSVVRPEPERQPQSYGVFGLWGNSMLNKLMHHRFISSILVESTHSLFIY